MLSPDEIDLGSASFYGIPGGSKGPYHMVTSDRVRGLFEEVGVHPDRIVVIGHTLDPKVLSKRDQVHGRILKALESKNGPLTLGMYIGGTGTLDERVRIVNIIKDLAGYIKEGKYKIKAIPGPHTEFARELHMLRDKLGLESSQFEIFSSDNRHKVIEVGHKWFVRGH